MDAEARSTIHGFLVPEETDWFMDFRGAYIRTVTSVSGVSRTSLPDLGVSVFVGS